MQNRHTSLFTPPKSLEGIQSCFSGSSLSYPNPGFAKTMHRTMMLVPLKSSKYVCLLCPNLITIVSCFSVSSVQLYENHKAKEQMFLSPLSELWFQILFWLHNVLLSLFCQITQILTLVYFKRPRRHFMCVFFAQYSKYVWSLFIKDTMLDMNVSLPVLFGLTEMFCVTAVLNLVFFQMSSLRLHVLFLSFLTIT